MVIRWLWRTVSIFNPVCTSIHLLSIPRSALIWLSPQSSCRVRAHSQTHNEGPSLCDWRPRRRLPPGCCHLCWRGEKVWSALAQVQAFWRGDNQTSGVKDGTTGFINRHSSWLWGLHAPPVIMFRPNWFYWPTLQLNAFEGCLTMLHGYGFIGFSLHSLHNFIVHIVLLYRGTLWHYKGL